MTFHFLQVLVLVGVFNSGIIFSSTLSIKKGHRKVSNYIGLFILLISLSIASYSILPSLRNKYDWLCLIGFPSVYFIGAVFLFFVKSSIKPDYKLSQKDFLYLIPGVLEILLISIIWIYVYFFNLDLKSEILNRQLFWVFHEGLAILVTLFFAIKGVKLFTNKTNIINSYYVFVFYGMITLLALWLMYYIVELSNYPNGLGSYYYPYWILTLAFYMFLGFNSLINPRKLFGSKIKTLHPNVFWMKRIPIFVTL